MAEDRGKPVFPPPDFSSRTFAVGTLDLHTVWSRVHRTDLGPCYFSRNTGNRFSSAGLGVIYVAGDDVTAFWEVFWDDLATRSPEQRRISRKHLDERSLCHAVLRRTPRLFDATDAKTMLDVSAPAATFSGDYRVCQTWAAALADHPLVIDGIRYHSARRSGGTCIALFERTFDCSDIEFDAGTTLGAKGTMLQELAEYGVRVLSED